MNKGTFVTEVFRHKKMKVYKRYQEFNKTHQIYLKKNSNSSRRVWKEKMDRGGGRTYAGQWIG